MSRDTDQTETGPLASTRAWVELRDATTDPAACDTSDAALVAAAVLADVRTVRDTHGEALFDTPAGSAGRRLANELNSIERLALASQRLGVEALTARLRHDQDHMATTCADMFWHLSEAAELLNGLEELRATARAEADEGYLSVVAVEPDADLEIIDLGPPPVEATIDLRTDRSTAMPTPSTGAGGRIVAAAMGIEPTEVEPDPAPADGAGDNVPAVGANQADADAAALAPVAPQSTPAWVPPQPTLVPVPERRPSRLRSWRARRREIRTEREVIVDDERNRGRGLRPLLPTWLSQGAATMIVVVLIALVAVGVWMMVVSDAGPF